MYVDMYIYVFKYIYICTIMPSSCPLGFDHSLDTHRSKNDRTVKKRPYGQKTTVCYDPSTER